MRKILIYSNFIIASLIVVGAFATASTYVQLGVATLLYLLLLYFLFKAFPRKGQKHPAIAIPMPFKAKEEVRKIRREKVDVADIDKRTFLKLIGAAGVSFFLFSLLGRWVESLLFSRTQNAGGGLIGTPPGQNQANTLSTNDYRISEIDDSAITYYGFTKNNGNWFIMKEDPDTGSFRYVRGDFNFSGNWNNRRNLRYDYYYKLF